MRTISVLILWLASISMLAQDFAVSGSVALSNGEPLPGVSVYLQGTKQGTVTKGNGQFLLKEVPAGSYTLVFSSVGFVKLNRQIEITNQDIKDLSITMVEDITQLPALEVESVTLTGGLNRREDLTGSSFYLSPKQLDQFSYSDINRTLRRVPGVYVQEEDGFGLRPNIGMRGSGSDRSSTITVMEDGVLAAPAPYAAPSAYFFPTIGRMHAVEVLKGSSQIKYGPFTAGGALNLVSTPIPTTFSGQLQVLGGSYGTSQLHAHVGNSHKNVGYMVETFNYGSDGFKELDNGGPTGFDKSDFLAKVRFNTNAEAKIYQSLLIKAGWSTERSHETYLGLTDADFQTTPFRRYFASQNDLMETDHRQLSATYTVQLNENIEANVVAYRNDFTRNWYKLDKIQQNDTTGAVSIANVLEDPDTYQAEYDILSSANGNGYDRAIWLKSNNRAYVSQGVQANISAHFTTGKVKHGVLASTRIHADEMDRFQYYDYYDISNGQMLLTQHDQPGTESNRIESAQAIASFVQYTFEWKKLTVVPGVRHEMITLTRDDFGKQDPERTGVDLKTRENEVNVLLPGIGFNYAFASHWQVFGGVHRGFTPPGTTPGTNPESSVNYELGVRHQHNALHLELVGFHNDYANLLGSDNASAGGAGTTELFNGGSASVNGIEFQASYDVLTESSRQSALPVFVSYTFTHATFQNAFESDFDPWGDVEVGDFLPYLPMHQLAFGASLEHNKYGIHLNGRYNSAMRTVAGQGEIVPMLATDAQLTFDISAQYAIHRQIQLFGSIVNATNATYIAARRPAGARPGTPRLLMGGIKAQF